MSKFQSPFLDKEQKVEGGDIYDSEKLDDSFDGSSTTISKDELNNTEKERINDFSNEQEADKNEDDDVIEIKEKSKLLKWVIVGLILLLLLLFGGMLVYFLLLKAQEKVEKIPLQQDNSPVEINTFEMKGSTYKAESVVVDQ